MCVNGGLWRSTNKPRRSTKHLQTNQQRYRMNPPNYLQCLSEKALSSRKNYNKGPAALHFMAHNNKQINNCEWITRKEWEIQAILNITYTVRYTVLLIIMGVETPRWKKHQGLSDGLNCICTVGWVSVHVNPCHVITRRSAANSVEATTCVAVQLRLHTIDLTSITMGGPHFNNKLFTFFLLSGCWETYL